MRKWLAVAFGSLMTMTAAPALAQAQDFGKQGDAVFSADRLFGIRFNHIEVDDDPFFGRDRDYDHTEFGIGWSGRGTATPFGVARFAFDYLVIDSLSIGGALGFVSYDDDDNRFFGREEGSEFILSPRVGYVIMFSDLFGFWPRGGFTYHSRSWDGRFGDDDVDESGFAFTGEAMFLLIPVENFGFNFGPTLDFDFAGEVDYGPGDVDLRYRTIGIHAGVFGWI